MKKNIWKKAFTLVELLVVITILAIISVVAYQNFWWAVDKAVGWRKISDVSTIETSLQQYKADNNYYPPTDLYSGSTNVWWYNSWVVATPSNKIKVTYNWQEIDTIVNASSIGWWKVYGSWILSQIWAKWTISMTTLGKKYLSKDLYDPEIWDLKVKSTSNKMIDYGIWRYVYAVYKKSDWSIWWNTNKIWTAYNIAYTVKENWTDGYITKIVWDYDEESCSTSKPNCPKTLIWTLSWWTTNKILLDKQLMWKENGNVTDIASFWSDQDNQWIPYTVTDFK